MRSGRTGKPIRLSTHAQTYERRRGFTASEVREAIRTGTWQPTRGGRLETFRDFPYHALWNGTFYASKRVRPIFVDDPGEIVVITVYTYFF